MSALELLHQLERQGFALTPTADGKLAVKPAGRLTNSLREQIRVHKAKVMALLTKPYLTPSGELRIEFTTDPKYHWWAGGQSIAATLRELNASADIWRRYVGD